MNEFFFCIQVRQSNRVNVMGNHGLGINRLPKQKRIVGKSGLSLKDQDYSQMNFSVIRKMCH
jgi:hypothetical protein